MEDRRRLVGGSLGVDSVLCKRGCSTSECAAERVAGSDPEVTAFAMFRDNEVSFDSPLEEGDCIRSETGEMDVASSDGVSFWERS